MSNCPGCDNSSTTYTRCNPPVSTNCVFYQGESKVCPHDETFTICKGDNLSNVQLDIFNKVCELAGDIDVTKIDLPLCAKEGWESNDDSILSLLKYMLDLQCQQKALLEQVDSYVNNKTILNDGIKTIDPFVQVCLTCCEPGCGSTTILLSQALTKIITCVCKAKDDAANALTKAEQAYNKAVEYQKSILELEVQVCRLTRNNIALNTTVLNIVNYLNDNGASLNITNPSYTGCPVLPANIFLNV